MTNFAQVIKECEAANGSGTKLIIANALSKLDVHGRMLVQYALNPYLVFGIKKFTQPTEFAAQDSEDVGSLFALFDKLASRELTGNAARNAWSEALSNFTQETASYLERVVEKDLKAGFSDETYNKVMLTIALPGSFEENLKKVDKQIKTSGYESFKSNQNYKFIVPVYACQLADKCESTEEFEQYVTFPCQADFKYDGERTQAFVTSDSIIYRSRSGKEAAHVIGLFDEDLAKLRDYLGYDFVLDGERCSDLGFTDTVNAKKAGNEDAKNNLRFRAFFLMPMADWLAQKTSITTRENRENLMNLLATLKLKKIILTEGREVKDYQDMMAYCNDAIDLPENAARKIEGLILKDWNATYQWDRTFAWTKVKRFYDVDARIVGFYPGRAKTRLANTVGGVNCVAFLENGERVEFNVGGGFDDPTREHMKNNPDWWLKQTVVIKYQEVSRSKSKQYASLRFCTFEHVRDDKLVEI